MILFWADNKSTRSSDRCFYAHDSLIIKLSNMRKEQTCNWDFSVCEDVNFCKWLHSYTCSSINRTYEELSVKRRRQLQQKGRSQRWRNPASDRDWLTKPVTLVTILEFQFVLFLEQETQQNFPLAEVNKQKIQAVLRPELNLSKPYFF